jgi:hypothetical protein
MKYLVIGGHARRVGKTALVGDIIQAIPEIQWAAVKISPHGHGAWQEQPTQVERNSETAKVLLVEDTGRAGHTGGSRYLAAGARRSFWLRTREGHLAEGIGKLETVLRTGETVILESNSVLEVIRPCLYLMVLDSAVREFKESARKWLGHVDAFVTRGSLAGTEWTGVPREVLMSKLVFEQRIGEALPHGLVLLIRNGLIAGVHPRTT